MNYGMITDQHGDKKQKSSGVLWGVLSLFMACGNAFLGQRGIGMYVRATPNTQVLTMSFWTGNFVRGHQITKLKCRALINPIINTWYVNVRALGVDP